MVSSSSFKYSKCFKYNTVLVLLNLENIDGRTKISNRQLHTSLSLKMLCVLYFMCAFIVSRSAAVNRYYPFYETGGTHQEVNKRTSCKIAHYNYQSLYHNIYLLYYHVSTNSINCSFGYCCY